VRAGLAALVLSLTLSTCGSSPSSDVLDTADPFTGEIDLPSPDLDGPIMLNRAIQERRSVREYGAEPLPIDLIGQLLWAGQGITSADGKRTSPSAGATYPLELYVVTADAVLHYLPEGHRVERRDSRDLRGQLQEAAFDQSQVGSPPAVIVIAAVFERTAGKYGDRARDYVNRESGHTAQNILLEATAYGLAAVAVGGFDPAEAADILGLPADHEPLYLIPAGFPAG
jgi:SagB-type dehydrogenase family enzyme